MEILAGGAMVCFGRIAVLLSAIALLRIALSGAGMIEWRCNGERLRRFHRAWSGALAAARLAWSRARRSTLTTIIYGIKNCDTMKKARAWLDSHGVAYDFHD